MTWPIPLQASLRGLTLYSQSVIVDPAGGFAGLAFTTALSAVVGY